MKSISRFVFKLRYSYRVASLALLSAAVVGSLPNTVSADCRGVYSKMCTPDGGGGGGDQGRGGGGCTGDDCPETLGEVFFGVDKEKRRAEKAARQANKAGVAAYERGDYDAALRNFEEAAKLNSDEEIYVKNVALACVRKADEALSRKDYREAARLVRRSLDLDDDPDVRRSLPRIEALARYAEAETLWEQGNEEEALALFKKAAAHPAIGNAKMLAWIKDQEARLERQQRTAADERARNAKRARNLSKANRLNDEAVTLLQTGDVDAALKQLTAARELVSDDPRINANWYVAKANIAHRNGQLDAVISNLEQAVQLDPSNAEARTALEKARSERDRAGEKIRQASATTLERLRNASSGRLASNAGEQLGRAERHSGDASELGREPGADEAQAGFDRAPTKTGATLVYPGVSGGSPSLASTIPAAGRNNPVVKKMVAWYDSLEAQKAEIDGKIEAIKEQQKTSKDPMLAVKIESLTNAKRRHSDDQEKAKAKIAAQLKDLSIKWVEADKTDTGASQKQAKQLEFIQD